MNAQQVAAFYAEVLCVGDEILMGRTMDTNSNWLCKRFYELGGKVKRVTVVGDDVDEIERAVRESVSRGIDWLIVTGGLGPTYDDKTLEGLAKAAGKELVFDDEAMKMVMEAVRRRGLKYPVDEGVEAGRRKMATIPFGSKALFNPVGTAPGVLLQISGTKVVSLPGVPSEMKAIFDMSVAPLISERTVQTRTVELKVIGLPEAAMAAFIMQAVQRHPSIYIKSHPQGFTQSNASVVIIQISGRGEKAEEVESVKDEFISWLNERGASYELSA